jgi:hypothetical protein
MTESPGTLGRPVAVKIRYWVKGFSSISYILILKLNSVAYLVYLYVYLYTETVNVFKRMYMFSFRSLGFRLLE